MRQDVSSLQVEALSKQFETVIKDNGGAVVRTEMWGLRTFAYKIKKNRKGHYVLLYVDSSASGLHEMERQMRLHEDILRYLSISVDSHDEEPSVIMQSRDRDEEKTRRDGVSDKNLEKTPIASSTVLPSDVTKDELVHEDSQT